jgi:hypothetical protein
MDRNFNKNSNWFFILFQKIILKIIIIIFPLLKNNNLNFKNEKQNNEIIHNEGKMSLFLTLISSPNPNWSYKCYYPQKKQFFLNLGAKY